MSAAATVGVVGVLVAYLLFTKVERDGPQHWLGWLLFLGLFGAIGYQIYLRA